MSSTSPSHPLIIGHRGAPGYRPEHTRAAFELAFALGADAVEPDLVATKDGVLVIRHENEISGTTDVASRPEFAARETTKIVNGVVRNGWFSEDFTWAELSTLRARERRPSIRRSSASFDGRFPLLRLRDLFEICDAAAESSQRWRGMVAEIKFATYFESIGLPLDELFIDEVKNAGWDDGDGRLIVESFERDVLVKVEERGIRAKRIYLVEDSGAPFDEVNRHGTLAADYAASLTEEGLYALAGKVDGISVNKSLILANDDSGRVAGTTDLVDDAHAAGLEVYTWTLRPENKFLSQPFRRGTGRADFGDWQGEFQTIMSTGIDGVFADYPDLAVSVREELELVE
ncbi:glycerophosphodiester phosphodiesterase family protein [Leifsonia sp. A12D58]|uniref:glycerophosphodiester phosphodiesterase family protein n=1 Tax=Leifsonia sp. A12D58 TaxID=3397674 RepID=UPI0039E04F08